MNKFVQVNGRKNHIYTYGQGPVTVVILSGSGVLFPSLEYRSLAKALAESCRVVGIEKLGYGHSDLSGERRTVDVAVNEYRSVLKALGTDKPVVLAAHSMGFLEALRWGQLFPSEISGIIGLDAATPDGYKGFNIEAALKNLTELSNNEQLKKEMMRAALDLLSAEDEISSAELEQLEALACRNIANPVWISEAENLRDAIRLIEGNDPYPQIPMLFFISNGEGTTMEKEVWIGYACQYLKNISVAQYELIDHPHNLYKFACKEMAERAARFIAAYIG